jgi:hypothetical protein
VSAGCELEGVVELEGFGDSSQPKPFLNGQTVGAIFLSFDLHTNKQMGIVTWAFNNRNPSRHIAFANKNIFTDRAHFVVNRVVFLIGNMNGEVSAVSDFRHFQNHWPAGQVDDRFGIEVVEGWGYNWVGPLCW